jgi:hypothetical protein
VATFGERLAVCKQTPYRFHTEMFNLRKLKEADDKEQYRCEISNRFPASENLDDDVDINRY